MLDIEDPLTITTPQTEFSEVNESVSALCWLPSSETDLLAAIKDSLIRCDMRQSWTKKQVIEEDSHMEVRGIKFDPFDANRFATLSKEMVKVYDIRFNRP